MTKTLVLVLASVLLVSCSSSPTAPTAMAAMPFIGGDVSAPVTTLREADRAPLGSVGANCASDTPIVTQANQHGGLIDYVARYPYGTSRAEGEVWQRVGEGATESYRRHSQFFIGDGAAPFLSYTTESVPREEGRYKYRTRRTECGVPNDGRDGVLAVGEWSEFKDFTVGDYPEVAVVRPMACGLPGWHLILGQCVPPHVQGGA